ncbi:MvaI/BcnI restriction endonuclease family protein, partial [Candidatus Symbiopectobacterium sp. NZEC135]
LFWITPDGNKEVAPGSQIILYPQYPEVRLSGTLKKCKLSPSHLMRPPTKQERELRKNMHRYLIIGVCNNHVLTYMSAWDDNVSLEIKSAIERKELSIVFSVFYEVPSLIQKSKTVLIEKLKEIHEYGYIKSRRLDKTGNVIDYKAKNGAGFTLESFFGIIPNGKSEPDFLDWELKAHSGSVVTLMTPEPNTGKYIEDIHSFMHNYASSKREDRVDFASIHKIGDTNNKTGLSLNLEGYDLIKNKIIDMNGGLFLRDRSGELVAGWSFEKLLNHWKRKHAKTCFVSYEYQDSDSERYYRYGPSVTLATGAEFEKFFSALAASTIYYDPGINIKYTDKKATVKKRNQFRIKWKDITGIYTAVEELDLTNC